MRIRQRKIFDIAEFDDYLHQLLRLQWCRDHPVACALLTVPALVAIGVVIAFFRPLNGRHLARR